MPKEKWDLSRPVEQDQEQWNALARQWLSLDHRGRHSYHRLVQPGESAATEDQMHRILTRHQTVRERNLSFWVHSGRNSPVWLRTCYLPELAVILDDEALYAPLAEDWSRILLRVPVIPDTGRYSYGEEVIEDLHDFDERPGPGEEFKLPLYEAALKERTMLYLIDEEALREKLIKILWLDIHGSCVWENRLRPDERLEFRGRMFEGGLWVTCMWNATILTIPCTEKVPLST
ncbi:Uu.00g010660.m01.CDS01 [Anthostomella pinea]|uniref:Uu.00g010660.m01.CDS01 n=1 Tax=Anthostomella pinea TaxID=933095 RepID=A0AAI8YMQ7_9PEZI|nr:Uu.00g010660.m01.CDS01 [Anthostomella pinea]